MSESQSQLRMVVSDCQALVGLDREVLLVVRNNPRQSRKVARVIRAMGASLHECSDLHAAETRLSSGSVGLLVYVADSRNDDVAHIARTLSERAPTVVLVEHADHTWFTEFIAEVRQNQSLASIIGAWADIDLLRTARKILELNLFGVEKYLSWGCAVHTYQITHSQEKKVLLDNFSIFLQRLRCPEQLVMRAVTVADEYLMNALYDAPVDAQGKRMHADRDRTEPVQLSQQQPVVVQFGADGHNVVFGCRDGFGSFDVPKAMQSLGRCFRGEEDQIRTGAGGAGIGLYMTYHYVDDLVINLVPGQSTELLAVMGMSHTAQGPRGKSVNLFIANDYERTRHGARS